MSLRGKITEELRCYAKKQGAFFGAYYANRSVYSYCTWWFKNNIGVSTREVRRELEKMEKDGLVTADRSQRNNTKWSLVAAFDDTGRMCL
jgi:hypothetical protein